MPRKNDIAGRKPLIIGSAVIVAGFVMLLSGAALACSIFTPVFNVRPDFEVLVVDRGRPVAGIPIQVFRMGKKHDRPLLLLKSDEHGRVAIKGLRPGSYFMELSSAISTAGAVVTVGDPKAKTVENTVELEFPQIVRVKQLQGVLRSANPKTPFEDVEVKLLLMDGADVKAAQFTGSSGKFTFIDTKPGLYALDIHAKQPTARRGWEAEGRIAVQVSPDAQTSFDTLDLTIAMTSCGINWAQCSPPAPIRLTSREMRVTDTEGAVVGSADVVVVDSTGQQVAHGTTDYLGIVALPIELRGWHKMSVVREGFTPLEQVLDFAAPDRGAQPLIVILNVFGTCSKASLENHATQK